MTSPASRADDREDSLPAGRNGRRESPKLSVTDLIALTTGFAVVFALPPVFQLGGRIYFLSVFPVWLMALITLLQCALWLNLATACAILVRRFRYDSMPKPAEWLVILVAVLGLVRVPPDIDTLINQMHQVTRAQPDFSFWRWHFATFGGLVVAVGGCLLVAARRELSAALSTLVAAGLLVVLFWSPLPVLAMQLPAVGPDLTPLGQSWLFHFARAILQGIGRFPLAFVLAMPALATFFTWRKRAQRRWVWTEWIGAGTALFLGHLWLLAYYFGSYEQPPTGWICERAVTGIGLLATCGVALPWARRWANHVTDAP